jgi:hypothetical protein
MCSTILEGHQNCVCLGITAIVRQNPFILSASPLFRPDTKEAGGQKYKRWSIAEISTAVSSARIQDNDIWEKHSSFVYKIERALEDGPVTMAAFLDKEGEFDNTTTTAEEYGVEKGVLI